MRHVEDGSMGSAYGREVKGRDYSEALHKLERVRVNLNLQKEKWRGWSNDRMDKLSEELQAIFKDPDAYTSEQINAVVEEGNNFLKNPGERIMQVEMEKTGDGSYARVSEKVEGREWKVEGPFKSEIKTLQDLHNAWPKLLGDLAKRLQVAESKKTGLKDFFNKWTIRELKKRLVKLNSESEARAERIRNKILQMSEETDKVKDGKPISLPNAQEYQRFVSSSVKEYTNIRDEFNLELTKLE